MTTNIKKLAELKKPESQSVPTFGGNQLHYKFKNGFGASVICHLYSYGGEDGLLELAVLDSHGGLTYDTPVTNSVEGHLSVDEALALLNQIEALPASA